ncbi:MAG: oxidative damage protection protein [Acidobacteriota bacterium]
MANIVTCARCGETKTALDKPPLPGKVGQQVQENICTDCWDEWGNMEVMVINELRLNFMDPKSQEILQQQMREFFHLQGE